MVGSRLADSRPHGSGVVLLHRWVGIFMTAAAFGIATLNFGALIAIYNAEPAAAIVHPTVWPIVALGLVAVMTAFLRKLAWIQVALMILTGVGAAMDARPGNLTPYIFLMVALVLAWEYGYLNGRTGLKAGVVSLVFLGVWGLSVARRVPHGIAAVVASFLGAALLAGLGWLLIVLRQREYMRRAEELETAVAERTTELQDALEEQKLLLAELHHRTKNNLQLVSTMLFFEEDTIATAGNAQALQLAQARIHSLGRVHELLYSNAQKADIDIGTFVSEYLGEASLLVQSQRLSIESDLTIRRRLRTDLAIRFGLILNEIVLNSMEHTAGLGKDSRLSIHLYEREDNLVLVAEDDGPGLSTDEGDRIGLGIQIIRQMAERLGGTAALEGSEGTKWTITLPLERRESPWD